MPEGQRSNREACCGLLLLAMDRASVPAVEVSERH